MRLFLVAVSAIALSACQGADTAPADTSEAAAAAAASETPAPAEAPSGAPAEHASAEGHEHGSPHGGTVKTAGAGHLELVVDGRDFKVYPLDGAEAALPVAGIAGAQALLQPEGGAALTVALAPMGDHLHGTLPEGATVYTAVVTVPVAGETRSARFEVGLDGDLDHAH